MQLERGGTNLAPQGSLPFEKTDSQVFSVVSVVCWQVTCLTVFRPSSLFLSLIQASCTYSLEMLQHTADVSTMQNRSLGFLQPCAVSAKVSKLPRSATDLTFWDGSVLPDAVHFAAVGDCNLRVIVILLSQVGELNSNACGGLQSQLHFCRLHCAHERA